MHILLDLDQTVFIGGKLHPEFEWFRLFVKANNHNVTVWSSHDDGEAITQLMGYKYLHKNNPMKPTADVLIDDCAHEFHIGHLCSVKKAFKSLDEFAQFIHEQG
jgi:hypothetical protein